SPNEVAIAELNVTVNAGEDALLDCHVIHEQVLVDGATVPVVWARDGQQTGSILESSRFEILPNGSLALKRVDFNDHGTYACVTSAGGGNGEETGYVRLLVKGRFRGLVSFEIANVFLLGYFNSYLNLILNCFGMLQ